MDIVFRGAFKLLANDTDCGGDDDNPNGPPPGTPPTVKFEGPWFKTQLLLSSTLGLVSFLLFSYGRTRWPLLFAPRTKLKGFSPHEAHAQQAFFGWIIPTIRTSEYTILQIVGLDAAVLLSFFRTGFMLFSVCSFFAVTILMPVNYRSNHGQDDDDDDDDWGCAPSFADKPSTNPPHDRDWLDLISDANSYLSLHLLFTYLFTILCLYFLYKNYRRFVRARQLFSLELVHSIAARTVMVTELPPHLRGERTLAEYFENMGLSVESVSVVREVASLKRLLDARTEALMKLEAEWVKYVGNPSTVESYDPTNNIVAPLVDVEPNSLEAAQPRFVVPHRDRPTLRSGWFQPKVDALDYLDEQFKAADEAVKKRRRTGKFKATHVAFVTFEKMSSAQIAVQTVHSTSPFEIKTHLAPEPRDIVWTNMTYPPGSVRARKLIVLSCMCILFFFWIFPITALASLLSYREIKRAMPWLGDLIDKSTGVRAVVQNSLPSVGVILLNATLPFLLEALSYIEGIRARSLIEHSLMKKYFLFLFVNVVFIFLLASTYWQLLRDLANSPSSIPERIAQALAKGRAKHFFLSYVILQGLGIMPMQLLNLGLVIPRAVYLLFVTRTPRDFAELNAPPMINYGFVYPQAILVFIVTLLYSVVQPLILPFGAIYFGVAYVVYKYKLLFVFYKPYESQGQAWPITFARVIWGVIVFLVFQTGIFILRKSYILSSLCVPLIIGTVAWSWYIHHTFMPLSKFVSLSSICEVQRGVDSADVARLKPGHAVTWSQSNLSRRRYAQNDETLYVAPEDDRTDYSQPPMANWYSGVLNTGKRRYGHPALNGVLPQPWLPLKKGQTLVNREHMNGQNSRGDAVVLSMRRRFSAVPRRSSRQVPRSPLAGPPVMSPTEENAGDGASPSDEGNPWRDHARADGNHSLRHRLSFDDASGVIMLPDNADWMMEDVGSDSDSEDYGSSGVSTRPVSTGPDGENGESSTAAGGEPTSPHKHRYSTYYHHPERRRQIIPGEFPL